MLGADTDSSPYDSGSYASSTTYVTGKAVERACMQLRERILETAAEILGVPAGELALTGTMWSIRRADGRSPWRKSEQNPCAEAAMPCR